MDLTITKAFREIPMAHRQHTHDGHCALIHGHGWDFEFTFTATQRDENGFILDFGKMDFLKAEMRLLDHACALSVHDPLLKKLADTKVFSIIQFDEVSCEGLAKHFFQVVNHQVLELTKKRVRLVSVLVREDSKNSAIATTNGF